jgi:hypothetical protein
MPGRASGFSGGQLQVECASDAARDLVLQGEQITRVAIEPLGPEVRVGLGIDQLGVDPDLIARAPDAPFQHIAHAKLSTDLLRVDWLVPISEGGIARDNEQPQLGVRIRRTRRV